MGLLAAQRADEAGGIVARQRDLVVILRLPAHPTHVILQTCLSALTLTSTALRWTKRSY
jgi:hypothetical protein